MLASQAKYPGIFGRRDGKGVSEGSAEVERAGGAHAGAFHDVEVDHGCRRLGGGLIRRRGGAGDSEFTGRDAP